jgi:CBS domain-containing protein
MSTTAMRAATGPLLALTAADLMSTPVVTIPHDLSLREAARLLSQSSISGAPVVNEEGQCIGVLSSSDFITWAGETGEAISFVAPWGERINIDDSPDKELRDYMTMQPFTVAPATAIGQLAQQMVDAHIHRVLVVAEQGRPCGIVASSDILAAVANAARTAASATENKRRCTPKAPSERLEHPRSRSSDARAAR